MTDDKIIDILLAKASKKGPKIIDPNKKYKVSGDLVLTLTEFAKYISRTKDFTPYSAQMEYLGYITKFLYSIQTEKFEEVNQDA